MAARRLTRIMDIIMLNILLGLDDFLVRAALAGVGLALATGPLGSFVVWRRMAYFGDATSHAAILGVALALALQLPVGVGTLLVALAMAGTVSTLAARGWAMDTTLGVLAHSALAFGLVAISYVPGVRADLSTYLFGDILAVSKADLGFIWAGALLVVALLVWRWQALLTATLNEDLAHASGLNPDRERLVLTPHEIAPKVGARTGAEILAYENDEDDLLVSVLFGYARLAGVPVENLLNDDRDLWLGQRVN